MQAEKVDKATIIRELAKQQALGVKKLMAIGSSYAIVIPMTWVKFHCTEIEGDYYFKLLVDGGSLVLKAITDEDVADVTMKRKDESDG